MIKVSRQRAYQIRNKAQGLCILCGKKARTKNHCDTHAKDNLERNRRWYKKRVATGLCIVCQKPRKKYKNECDACRKVRREYHRAYLQRQTRKRGNP